MYLYGNAPNLRGKKKNITGVEYKQVEDALLHLTILPIEFFVDIYSIIPSGRILPTDSRTEIVCR
jgi:hypothetical protein